ncbi:hypothetical protein PRZ48_010991 [Zasmidium cellare]|uniref:Glycosyltransferase n=1 Tax=Zasmidium cellare TaxID=395010 RepID=A0ABR0EA68_ZASCE|nr:hypothetical protein PRZ48_010991 [Zasmidium cellare]
MPETERAPASMAHNGSPRMLMVTNADRGQANVFLAVAAALLAEAPSLQLHFASFSSLEETVAKVSASARRRSESARSITFHALRGRSMKQAIDGQMRAAGVQREHEDYLPASYTAAPLGFQATLRAISDTLPIFFPYTGPELVEVYQSVVDTIQTVDPDLVVVDCLMAPALTACESLAVPWVCLSPNSIKDFALGSQPLSSRLANLCRFPALFSGFPYPVPWLLWLRNALFNLYKIKTYLGSMHRVRVSRYFHAETGVVLSTPLDLMRPQKSPAKVIVSSLPAIDFPLIMPKHIVPCGPIVLSGSPLAEADPRLDRWLGRRPTIYINFGSIHKTSEELAMQMAQALSIVLSTATIDGDPRPLQVLWKLNRLGHFDVFAQGSRIHRILGEYLSRDRIRIVEWITADPSSILASPNVVCAIHHGGANSYNEAIL